MEGVGVRDRLFLQTFKEGQGLREAPLVTKSPSDDLIL